MSADEPIATFIVRFDLEELARGLSLEDLHGRLTKRIQALAGGPFLGVEERRDGLLYRTSRGTIVDTIVHDPDALKLLPGTRTFSRKGP
jgi:hypothetical protein